MAKRFVELGCKAAAITDHGNVGAGVDFSIALRTVCCCSHRQDEHHGKERCKVAGCSCMAYTKAGIKPILGFEAYLARDSIKAENGDPQLRKLNGRPYSHLVVLAKDREGWRQILRAVSRSNTKPYFYYNPRLSLEDFEEFAQGGHLIAISGHPGSDLANCIFHDQKAAYACESKEQVRSVHLRPDAKKVLKRFAERYISIFGRENFRLEVQVLNPDAMPAALAVAAHLRWLSGKLGIPCVATADSHYVLREDAQDQRVLLCSQLKTTMPEVMRRIEASEETALGGFFRGNCFHIPSEAEMLVHHTREELDNAVAVGDMIEDFDILSQPRIPHFACPDGMDENAYLRQLCREGFRRLILDRKAYLDRPVSEYTDRVKRELEVIEGAGLAGYFLIVQDLTRYGRERGWLLGPGRGSSAGCLLSYLLGITSIDPLPYGLMFERFYNAGRNKPGHVSLPDIDLDFPLHKRDEVFRYMQVKYGKDKVAKIATFNSLAGKSALDEVLRVHEVPYDERKLITDIIPDPARITEELQDMRERGEDPSVLQYSLETFGDDLSEWVQLEEDGSLSGRYAGLYRQAQRLEGVKKNTSIHAAGVIISAEPLEDICPLTYDQDEDCAVGAMDYGKLEALGLVKIDLLRIALLNKGEGIRELCRHGELTGA